MYFPYLRGRQFELIALRELIENHKISKKVIPIIEPVKSSSTLLKTIKTFTENGRLIAVVFNPSISDFVNDLKGLRITNPGVGNELYDLLLCNDLVIKSYLMNDSVAAKLKKADEKKQYLIVNPNRDCLDSFLEIYETEMPRYTLIPDDRAFRRLIPDAKVLFADCFHKRPRNVDYLACQDEFFSENHLYYKEEGYVGFADYSVVGEGFNESGFAPVAVAIHIVYPANKNVLRIHHFVSDSNIGIEDTAGKFGEALEKLVLWCNEKHLTQTMGLQGFYNCYNTGRYPGLGTVKKYSIMHHLELMSHFMEGEDV